MQNQTFSTLLLILATAMACAQSASAPQPPVAEKIHTEKPINGATLVDDYAWLRERSSPQVRQYLEAENAYAEAVTASQKPFAEKLYQETLSHIKQSDTTVPYQKHGYWYYSRTEEGKQYPVLCRKKETLSAPEEIMLDVNQLAQGEKFMALGAAEVSDDSRLLAYTTDNVGFRQYRLHVKNLQTGKLLNDTAERVDGVTWAADNKTIFYTTEDAVTKRADPVRRHQIGTPSHPDPIAFHEKDERYPVGIDRTRDGRYVELSSESHITSEVQVLPAARPTSAWQMIEPRTEGGQDSVDEGNGLFYIR